jgi:hypothetical protein
MKKAMGIMCIRIFQILGRYCMTSAQVVYYVSNGGWWDLTTDIYSKNITTGETKRLTSDPLVDNHPSISHFDTNWVMFNSRRGNGEFDIYVA